MRFKTSMVLKQLSFLKVWGRRLLDLAVLRMFGGSRAQLRVADGVEKDSLWLG